MVYVLVGIRSAGADLHSELPEQGAEMPASNQHSQLFSKSALPTCYIWCCLSFCLVGK
jgi:hypothetical protein